jgi:ABC-type nickel/cobalt efflux system permease component RcnA
LGGLIAVALLLTLPLTARAHPLGNFTINRYSRLVLQVNQITLTYIVDMAEIPTYQERGYIDLDGDGHINAEEQGTYLNTKLAELQQNLHLTVNGRALTWELLDSALTFPEGQASLLTLRLYAQFAVVLPSHQAVWQAEYRDENYGERIGWQEVVVHAADGVKLLDSTAPTEDLSQELSSYPTDLLQSPPAVHWASFRFAPLSAIGKAQPTTDIASNGVTVASDAMMGPTRAGRPADPYADLVKVPISGPTTILVALLASFGWGAAHAFSPGHGKTVVGAYVVGSRGTVRHALFLGLTTTIVHTAGVFVLGFVALFASEFILPERLYPWLGMTSGLFVVVIGASLVWRRIQGISAVHAYNPSHSHDHGHDHHHDHHHFLHSHQPQAAEGSVITWRRLLALGIAGGLVPCPSALVVMLGAISLQRIGFGLILIVMFSLGLAGVLTAIGITLVYAGRLFQWLPEDGPVVRLLPLASAVFITIIGVGITLQAFLQIAGLKLT